MFVQNSMAIHQIVILICQSGQKKQRATPQRFIMISLFTLHTVIQERFNPMDKQSGIHGYFSLALLIPLNSFLIFKGHN